MSKQIVTKIMKIKPILFLSLLILLLMECSSSKKNIPSDSGKNLGSPIGEIPSSSLAKQGLIVGGKQIMPHAFIYKTRKDYSKNVPVILSNDKTRISSYPDISDVYYNGKLAYPTALEDGYWLDNKGIGANVAFLNYTYEEYSKLPKTPSAKDLYKRIIDKNPLVKMVDCGVRYNYKDETAALNSLIKEGLPNTTDVPLNNLNLSIDLK